jgi:hypothetical protein
MPRPTIVATSAGFMELRLRFVETQFPETGKSVP